MTIRRGASAVQAPLVPVRTPESVGWLQPPQVVALIEARFGLRVTVRTVQGWCRRAVNPLPCAHVGTRVLVHEEALVGWILNGRPASASVGAGG